MSIRGARILADYAGRKIHLECRRCQLRRRYDADRMIARIGATISLPDLLNRIAIGEGCMLNAAPTPNGQRCGMTYARSDDH